MKNTGDIKAESDIKDKKLTNESLLLPCVSGNKSTSASLAERSNVWAENKLCEKKVTLDKKLHKSIIRLNVDILEVADELSKLNRMKKSSSTGALDKLHAHAHNSHHLSRDHHESKFKTTAPASPKIEIQTKKTRQSHEEHSKSTSSQTNEHKTVDKKNGYLLKPSENKNGIGIKIGCGSSSDELSDDEKQGVKANTKTFSASACQNGRQCSSRRSEQQAFENTTRRFKHLKTGAPSKHVK